MFCLLLHKVSGVLEFFRFYFLSNPHRFFSWETSSIPVLIRHPLSQSKTLIWPSFKFQKGIRFGLDLKPTTVRLSHWLSDFPILQTMVVTL